MKSSNWTIAVAVLVSAAGAYPVATSAQAQAQTRPAAVLQVEKAAAALAPKGWKVPKLPDGHPDLQGLYTNQTTTPAARPKALGDQVLYTKEEQDAATKAAIERRKQINVRPTNSTDPAAVFGVGREYDNTFIDFATQPVPTLQTSLVVDPPNGQMPDTTQAVKDRAKERAARVKELCADPTRVCPPGMDQRTPSLADTAADFTLMNRCIEWGTSGPPMSPSVYDSNYQIVQTPDYVEVFTETIHDHRVIPTDGRAHLPDNIRQLAGDSVGHWEGNTLVVDTTNFNDMTNVRGAGPNLHVVERFTRVSPTVLLYEFTVSDTTSFVAPYTEIIPMTTIKGPIFEYACNEGNYALQDIMHAARLEEQKRAAARAAGSQEGQPKAARDNGGSGQQ